MIFFIFFFEIIFKIFYRNNINLKDPIENLFYKRLDIHEITSIELDDHIDQETTIDHNYNNNNDIGGVRLQEITPIIIMLIIICHLQ
jgi:hypothetical protein